MIKIRSLSVILAVVVSLAGAAAHAAGTGLFRAYLSKSGIDTNPCTLPQPCRLLPAALAVTADGGEIWILDSANYTTTTVNIAQSVTILAIPGVVGSVVASGADAIDVASGASLALRNLVIGPLPGAGGLSGIQVSSGSTLVVEDCLIANLATA